MKILETIRGPEDFRAFAPDQLRALAAEVRERILGVVSETGGHLASSLGAVELTLALHYVYDTPIDKIVWDVGHQTYAHKILTGRNDRFPTIRQHDGLSGFPRTSESPYDTFDVGHASTSISVALGLAAARELKKENHHVVAVIGDGSMTGGLAFEGLNNAGALKPNITVILNDNKMSISPNVGAMSTYLSRVISDPRYNKLKADVWEMAGRLKSIGLGIRTVASRVEESLKGLFLPGRLFEDLGFRYFGPIDGHNLEEMIGLFTNIRKNISGPVLIHVLTKKGKGYKPAESDAGKFHGISGFEMESGKSLSPNALPTYSAFMGQTLVRLGSNDQRITAITAAMPTGTGLDQFARQFPARYFDVGIAEGHAVTFAGGLARCGLKPLVALYSTFLQRAIDNVIHDVALQNLDVVFCVDRGGLTPDDGPTHHGIFDIACLRCVPGAVLMSPRDENELQHMLYTAFRLKGPVFIRYPRSPILGVALDPDFHEIPLGAPEIVREGKEVLLLGLGEMVGQALAVADILASRDIRATVVDSRFAKPLDEKLFLPLLESHHFIFTLETGTRIGGFGSAIMELMNNHRIHQKQVHAIGFPDDFISHGGKGKLYESVGLSVDQIAETIRNSIRINKL